MKNYLTIFSLATLFAIACKDVDDPPGPADFPDYANLKVGNYWIYERYKLDSNGLYTALGDFDSTFVEKDTFMNGQTYFKYMDDEFGTNPGFEATFLRDSLHYLINSGGSILFSSQNFTDTLLQHYLTVNIGSSLDTICFLYRKMADDNMPTATPAGTFISKNARVSYIMYTGFDTSGKNRYLQQRYAQDVGMIEETLPFYIGDPSKSYTVRRLVRYGAN